MIFRYPGGNGKLVKKFIQHIPTVDNFADIFVGGGSVALKVASRDLNTKLYLNDLDPWVSSFWEVVTGRIEDFKDLIKQIRDLPEEEMKMPVFTKRRERFQPEDFSKRNKAGLLDAAFNALFFNRTTFSGCLGSGPIGGYDQSGDWHLHVRWNPRRLIKEIEESRKLLFGRTTATCLDFQKVIEILPLNCFIYADPPYPTKGRAIYGSVFKKEDHQRLFDTLNNHHNWLLSNDNSLFIKSLYKDFKQISLAATSRSMVSDSIRSKNVSELIIFSKGIQMEKEKEKSCKTCKKPFFTNDDRKVYCPDHTLSKEKNTNSNITSVHSTTQIKTIYDILDFSQLKALTQSKQCTITRDQLDQLQEASKKVTP